MPTPSQDRTPARPAAIASGPRRCRGENREERRDAPPRRGRTGSGARRRGRARRPHPRSRAAVRTRPPRARRSPRRAPRARAGRADACLGEDSRRRRTAPGARPAPITTASAPPATPSVATAAAVRRVTATPLTAKLQAATAPATSNMSSPTTARIGADRRTERCHESLRSAATVESDRPAGGRDRGGHDREHGRDRESAR